MLFCNRFTRLLLTIPGTSEKDSDLGFCCCGVECYSSVEGSLPFMTHTGNTKPDARAHAHTHTHTHTSYKHKASILSSHPDTRAQTTHAHKRHTPTHTHAYTHARTPHSIPLHRHRQRQVETKPQNFAQTTRLVGKPLNNRNQPTNPPRMRNTPVSHPLRRDVNLGPKRDAPSVNDAASALTCVSP